MRRFDAIEGLRGWLAWWVVLGHALQISGTAGYLPGKVRMIVAHGDWSVMLFMIISGFVIAHLLLGKQEDYRTYITRRYFRLMPLFLATMAFALLLRPLYEAAWVDSVWAVGREMRAERIAQENAYPLQHLLLHLTMLHGVLPDSLFRFANSSFVSPAWSLSLEWQFYLLAPLLVWAMRGRLAGAAVLAAGLGLAGLALGGWFGSWRYPSFILLSLPLFLIGMASRLLLEAEGRRQAAFWLAAGIAMLIAYWEGSRIGLVLIAAVWTFFLSIAVWQPRWLEKMSWLLATNPVTLALGRISFSTYIAHVPIFSLVVGGGLMLTGRSDQPTVILLTILAFAAIVVGSMLLYRFVELPGIELGRRLAASRGPLITPDPVLAEQN
jgi:peptidoglycan/LPS O-acetylase OafA/YrhL